LSFFLSIWNLYFYYIFLKAVMPANFPIAMRLKRMTPRFFNSIGNPFGEIQMLAAACVT